MLINGKEYKLEYTVEAALCDECVERTMSLFMAIGEAQNEQDVKKVVSAMTDIPRTSLYLFYGGLLENHSDEIESVDDAKHLVGIYFKENKGNEDANFYGLLTKCLEQMREDGFFSQIGLEQAITQTEEANQKTIPMNRQQRRTKASAK